MKLLTPEQVCEKLQITKPSLYKLVHLKKIPHAKVGKRLRFAEEKIEKWIDEKTVEAVNY
ncbi:helix-turn-helix domain-containing protein [Deltaproteobacteria bacterium]|nr:helix-turn-helix domain-containing protein [Deltaproteobacteria bacterium]